MVGGTEVGRRSLKAPAAKGDLMGWLSRSRAVGGVRMCILDEAASTEDSILTEQSGTEHLRRTRDFS